MQIIDNIQDISGQELADIISALPEWRRQVVLRYKFESGRRESALAFSLLQKMLVANNLLDEESVNNIVFKISEHGKPCIQGHDDIHFNLSHCKHAVACAVSHRPVGVDVECIGRYNEGVARYTLSEDEFHRLLHNEDGSKRDDSQIQILFTVLWTKKEALLKLLGTGITDNIKDILSVHDSEVEFETTINEERKYVCTTAKFK